MIRAFSSAIVLALLLLSGSASADDEAAATAAFDRGVELYRAKKFRDAAESFERARSLAPRGPTSYNAGRAWKAANEPAFAADAFATALEIGGLSEAQKRDATEQLKGLDAALGVLDLEGPPGAHVRVDTADRALPAHVRVAPGPFRVAFSSGSITEEKSGSIARGEHVTIAWQPPAPKPVVVAPPAVTKPMPPAPPPTSPADPYKQRRVLSIAAIVVGSGVLVGGIYEGIDGMSTRDRFVDGGQHDKGLHDSAEEKRLLANVLGIGGLAIIGAGVYFLVTTPSAPASSNAAVLRIPSGAMP